MDANNRGSHYIDPKGRQIGLILQHQGELEKRIQHIQLQQRYLSDKVSV